MRLLNQHVFYSIDKLAPQKVHKKLILSKNHRLSQNNSSLIIKFFIHQSSKFISKTTQYMKATKFHNTNIRKNNKDGRQTKKIYPEKQPPRVKQASRPNNKKFRQALKANKSDESDHSYYYWLQVLERPPIEAL